MAHADACYPFECCGVIVDKQYIPCRNISNQHDQFEIHPEDLAIAEDQGNIVAFVHSHPDGTTRASELDLVQIELHKKPWVICSYPELDFCVYEPKGYKPPLVGRNYFHGWQDCYALIRDFYIRELGIELMDFKRDDAWWEDKDHPSLYLENYEKQVSLKLINHNMAICWFVGLDVQNIQIMQLYGWVLMVFLNLKN